MKNDEEVERLSRIMCRVEGVDPDQRAIFFQLQQGPRGMQYLPEGIDVIGPAWEGYARLARGIVDSYPKTEPISACPRYSGTYMAWFAELVDLAYGLVMPRMMINLNENFRRQLVRKLHRHLACEPSEEE